MINFSTTRWSTGDPSSVTDGLKTTTTEAPLWPCEPHSDNIHERVKQWTLVPLTVLILASNGAVLSFIALKRKLRRPTYWFVTSLGVADMFVGLVSMATIATRASEPTLDLCLVRIGFTVAAIEASLLSLMFIAIDRYIAISMALRYTQIMTPGRNTLLIAAKWVASFALGFAPLLGWNNPHYQQYCSFLYVETASYVIFLFAVGAVVPICVILVIYFLLYRYARKHIRKIDALERLGFLKRIRGPFGVSSRGWRAVRTLLAVDGCLLMTWLPFMVATVVHLAWQERLCGLKDVVGTHLLLLGFSNSFLNPLIYAIGTKDFRDKFRQTLRLRCGSLQCSECACCSHDGSSSASSVPSNT